MSATPIRLLVVDDDEDDFVLVRDLLAEAAASYDVEWASDFGAGRDKLRERRHDAYLIDYRLGGESGVELLGLAREANVHAPLIMLTGQNDVELDRAAMLAGAADYLVKSRLDSEQLDRTLRYAIDRARDKAALEANEARYRQLFDRVPMPMWVYDRPSRRFLAVNDAAIDHYGYTREEFLAMTIPDIHAEDEHDGLEVLDDFLSRPKAGLMGGGLWRHKRKDGQIIDVEVTSHSVDWGGHDARMVLAKDVTEQLRAQRALRVREFQLRQILSDASDALIVVGRDGRVRFANPAVHTVLGNDPDELLNTPFELPHLGAGGEGVEIELARAPGDARTVEVRTSETEWEGEPANIYALRDVSERRRAEARARLLERAIESSTNGVLIADARDPQLPILYANRAFERMTGYAVDEVIGRNCGFLQGADVAQPEVQVLREALRKAERCEVVLRNYTKSGTLFWNQLSIAPVRDAGGNVTHFIGVLNDVTERRRYESELAYLASHDPVTGLSRYVVLQDYAESVIAQDNGVRLAMLFIDIDRFHSVNETMGHVVGDQALRVFADRLRAAIGDGNRVCRLAGDEFLVAVAFADGAADPPAIAHRIRDAMRPPVEVGLYRLYLTCSIGIACYPENGANATDILHAAEAAMGRAKALGRNNVYVFTNEQADELKDRLSLGGRLRDAIAAGEMVLHYQPQVEASTGQIVGVEALVRWQTQDMGLLPPGRFIRVAEELGLIVELGHWVLEDACRQTRAWCDAGLKGFTVAVNVSALQLQRPSFVDEVRDVLREFGVDPRMLELELTESAIMDNVDRTVRAMDALKRIGVQIALDDFGIGYSSLNYLKRFPIDKLKIDQSFVREVTQRSDDAAIARAIIAMGHQLQMTVMAEGVETQAQLGYLRRNHCDQLQGMFLGGPVPAEEAGRLLRKRYLNPELFVATQPSQTLLLLDDEENILHALTRLLRRDGYKIFTATSLSQAFDILGKHQIHVIVSDQRMPDGTGTDFLSKVKEIYPDTVRMVLSGYTDLHSVTEAINRGAIYKFLTKPWDDDDLRRQVQEAFRTHSASA